MKINHEYLKGLLEAFESSEEPIIDIYELEKKGFSYNKDVFIFHIQILVDKNLVQSENGDGLGFNRNSDWTVRWNVIPLRLTAEGHDFLEAIRNNEVWDSIKSEFKDASLGTLLRVSKELIEGYTKKKVTLLLSSND